MNTGRHGKYRQLPPRTHIFVLDRQFGPRSKVCIQGAVLGSIAVHTHARTYGARFIVPSRTLFGRDNQLQNSLVVLNRDSAHKTENNCH